MVGDGSSRGGSGCTQLMFRVVETETISVGISNNVCKFVTPQALKSLTEALSAMVGMDASSGLLRCTPRTTWPTPSAIHSGLELNALSIALGAPVKASSDLPRCTSCGW